MWQIASSAPLFPPMPVNPSGCLDTPCRQLFLYFEGNACVEEGSEKGEPTRAFSPSSKEQHGIQAGMMDRSQG